MTAPTGKLPIWMDGERASALKRTSERWWEQVLVWMQSPLTFGDALTVPLAIVDLFAYQRNIVRAAIDTERRYRLKVHHALQNARDAGTLAGMSRIFGRLELPVFELTERIAGYDWDVIGVDIDIRAVDSQRPIIADIWGLYGRTCRRFAIRGYIESESATRVANVGAAMQVLHSSGRVSAPSITSATPLRLSITGNAINILTTTGAVA